MFNGSVGPHITRLIGDGTMNRRNKEKISAALALMIFFAAFTTIALMDRTHGTNGEGIGANEVNVDVTRNEGHLSIPNIPSSLLVLATDTETKLDLEVENNDRDNDIDTIVVKVPGSDMENGSTMWYDTNFLDHEWDLNITSDEATFVARDDWFGRIFGGSAQYDVVGNQDDALDHFEQNDTISMSISESITVTVDFTTPSTSGIMKGNDGIQVSVGDLKTEETSSSLTALYPNGFPYLLIEDGYEVLVIDVNSDKISLEVQYGGKTLFSGTTRALSGYKQATEGISYTEGGHTYAILDAPAENVVVKPLIKGTGDGTGDVEVKMQQILVKDKTKTGTDLFDVVKDNSSTVPVPPVGETYVDTDGDWIFDINDDDDDGDGIPDARDPQPLIPGTVWINENPTINSVTGPQEKVKKGNAFTLSVNAEDTDSDPLTFTWTLAGSNWTDQGESVTGPNDLESGDYTFTITVTDNKGGESLRTISVNIAQEDKEENDSNWIIYIIVAVVLILIVIGILLYMNKSEGEEDLETEELEPQEEEDLIGPEEPTIDEDDMMEEDEEEGEGEIADIDDIEEGGMEEEEDVGDIVPPIPEVIDEMQMDGTVISETCPSCNTPLGPTDSECPTCGAEFEIELECPICGTKVDPSLETCPRCGVSFM